MALSYFINYDNQYPIHKAALVHINQALKMNPYSKEVRSTRSRCNLQLGNWQVRNTLNAILLTDYFFFRQLLRMQRMFSTRILSL
jgi:hypothetical protein